MSNDVTSHSEDTDPKYHDIFLIHASVHDTLQDTVLLQEKKTTTIVLFDIECVDR